jgi:hypothetical protein
VRCIFRTAGSASTAIRTYEERVTVWRAANADEAIQIAEVEAREYADAIDADYLGLAQVYVMSDSVGHGAEVFSLMRDSRLDSLDYVAAFFNTGSEHQASADPNTA